MIKVKASRNNEFLIIYCIWIIATISTMGSMFFSEVMEFPPCVLCWYQRIAMYPLVLILLVGAFSLDKNVVKYSFPLAFAGWLIAIYHNLLNYEVIPESASPCIEGVSCSTVYINWLGFINIPLLSLVSFSLILTFLVVLHKRIKNEK